MASDAKIDQIYDAVDALMFNNCWAFINDHLACMTPTVWRMDLDILLAYATVTKAGKTRLYRRKAFIDECIRYWSDPKEPDLWKGLE